MEVAAADDERALWEGCGSDAVANASLFARYAPWARAVARDVYRRLRNPLLEWGDYAQNASVGLLEAMSRYDPKRGIDFIAYAKPRVRGAVFNGVRIFLERSGDEGGNRTRARLASIEDQPAGDILQHLVNVVTGLGVAHLLDADAHDGWSSDADASAQIEQHQRQVTLAMALEDLPDKERLVLNLHYYQHLPFVAIAQMLGLTKGRISQLHRSGLERMARSLSARRIGPSQLL